MAKWDELKAMREEHSPTPIEVIMPENTVEKVKAAEEAAAKAAVKTPAAPEEKAPETPKVEETVVETKPEPAVVEDAPVEIEIDGQKVAVDPALADAFQKAEKIKKRSSAAEERARLKAEIAAELKAEIQATPPGKSAAELAAEKALEDAKKLKRPDEKLLIEDPAKYNEELDNYLKAQIAASEAKTKAEIHLETQAATKVQAEAAEKHARAVLGEQFYDQYPIFKGTEKIVDKIMDEAFEEVRKSGRLARPLNAAEGEALKKEVFAEIATRSTKEVVSVMNVGKKVAPPAAPPPKLVASAPSKPEAPVVKTEEPKEKYPRGSVSALLAARKASKEGASA